MPDFLGTAALYVVPLLFAVIIHEVSHGWVAEKLGDPTARALGRITLNPLVHIDLVGTIILPGILLLSGSPFLFGWAKPVPVNFGYLRGGRKDMALVAFSGPLSNFVLAALSSAIFHFTFSRLIDPSGAGQYWYVYLQEPVRRMALFSLQLNLVLMVVNLLPILPLDGGRIVSGLAPIRIAMALERTERFGMLILLVLIGSGLWSYIVTPLIAFFMRFLL